MEKIYIGSLKQADVVIKAGRIYSMRPDRAVFRSMALRHGKVAAMSTEVDALDKILRAGIHVIDDPGLTVFPAFIDSHNHQLWAARDVVYVALDEARTIDELVAALHDAAQATSEGEWVISQRCWHESHLKEGRLPTAADLDRASDRHPIIVQRGGHVAILNTRGLEAAGIDAGTPDPPRGLIERGPGRVPTGVLVERPVHEPVRRLLPTLGFDQQVDHLARQCRLYNSRGIATVRDVGILHHEWAVYQKLWERRELTVRSRVLFFIMPGGDIQDRLAEIDSWAVRSGFGDDRLKIWGLMLSMDGGVEGAAMSQPYANNPDFRGHVLFDVDDATEIIEFGVQRGWKMAAHAAGDVALTTILDAFERVVAKHPDLPRGTLVIEHALLADADHRRRAVELGVEITVSYPLLYSLGASMIEYWGRERTGQVLPISAWIEDGASIAAGSDCNVSFFDPMLNIWGMVTRGTRAAGTRGRQYAIDQYTAVELYTAAGGRLLDEEGVVGTLQPGSRADLAGFRADLTTCPVDDIPGLAPVFTVVGGDPVHDPEGLFQGMAR